MPPSSFRPPQSGISAVTALLLLASCGTRQASLTPSLPISIVAAATCRTAPDGGPLQADRGIGGTGAPATRLADKGIGGTGIVGVITGFASICVGGQEVAYDPTVPVLVDHRAASPSDLRAGQLAAIEASGPGTDLAARRVTIRHEVIGPVETQDSAGVLRIAGQRVAVAESTLGDRDTPPGAWVAVSGFRDADGLIHATRLDRKAPGEAEVHGTLKHEGRFWRIGTLDVRFSRNMIPPPDGPVWLEGHYAAGILTVSTVTPDLWNIDGPSIPALFGPSVEFVFVETFAGYAEGRLMVGRSRRDRINTEFERAVIELERRPDGSLQPTRTRDLAPSGIRSNPPGLQSATPSPARRFEPAPVPARGMGPDRAFGLPGQSSSGLSPPGQSANRPGLHGPEGGNLPGTFPGNLPVNPFPGGLPGRGR